jgi:hypothetical protein
LENIIDSRAKRQGKIKEMSEKQNKRMFNRSPEFPFIFSRGYNVQ